jgi:hypothetical protein
MPPLFRPPKRRYRASAKALPSRRWCQMILVWLGAIAVGAALTTATSRRPPDNKTLLMPVADPPRARGLLALLSRRDRPQQPLTVPPLVQPQPLPPEQAWPDLPRVQAQPGFTDLDAGHWAWPLLSDLAQRELLAGFPDGSFRPADPMTRAEFAAQVARLFDFPQDRSQTQGAVVYRDVTPNHWAYSSVHKAVQMGFLNGYPDGEFLPDETISRIHVVVALANGLTLKSSRAAANVLAPYADHTQVPPWAIRQLVAATETGLVVNYPALDTLAPNRPASRAEVAAMLHRAMVYTGTLQDVPFPYVAGQSAGR